MNLPKPLSFALLAFALATPLAACGKDDSPAGSSETEASSEVASIDPTAVEASIQEFLDADEIASSLSPAVDCGDESAETIDCTISGDEGLQGGATAAPSEGFEYTGEVEEPQGTSSFGGSQSEGSIADPASIEASLNDVLADGPGKPTADCPDAADGESIDCEVTGDGVSGTITATPIGGFEWQGEIETPDGTRAIAGNELP